MTRSALFLFLFWASACTGRAPHPEPTSAPTSTVDAPPGSPTSTASPSGTASPPSSDGGPTGTWSSPSCGARKYPREITLEAGGAFRSRDLVSPCPENVACVWSGIVERSGKWKLDGAKIALTVEDGADSKAGEALPAELAFEAGALSEPGCPYQRK